MNKLFSSKIYNLILSWLSGDIKEEQIFAITDYDWAFIDEVAKRKAITSFIFHKFKEQDSLRLIPQPIRDIWQQHFYNNLKRNEIALQGLVEVLSQLKSSNIEAMLLKGASLLIDGYSNAGIRPMGDVDILVKKEDTRNVSESLKKMGFNLTSEKSESSINEFGADLMFSNNNFVLEAFPNLYQYERFKGIIWSKESDIWENSRFINFNGQPVRILSFEDQMLHLSQRLCIGHLLKNVIHFLDIKELLQHRKNSLNWDSLLNEASRQNLRSCLYYALIFAKNFFCKDIPDWVIEELKPAGSRRILINLFINKNYIFGPKATEEARGYILQALFMDKSLDSLKVALRGIFPSREWFLYRYGQKAAGKIYFYRINHLFKILFN